MLPSMNRNDTFLAGHDLSLPYFLLFQVPLQHFNRFFGVFKSTGSARSVQQARSHACQRSKSYPVTAGERNVINFNP